MTINIAWVSPSELEAAKNSVVQVYQATFALPPFHEGEAEFHRFASSLTIHAARPGFRACLASDTHTSQVVGFAYGYTSLPGQWWHDTVTTALPTDIVVKWFDNC